jgi:REP element-mobilizing transposase RayT
MGRLPRYVPVGGSLVEVVSRTLHRRFFLRPDRVVNEIIVGTLARACAKSPGVEVVAAVFLSNHFHLLLWVPDARALATFVGYLKTNLSKKIGRLRGWREKIWGRRYDVVPVTGEEAAQIARLKYVLAHGAKEDLVPQPRDWPGVHSARELLSGEPLRGFWFDDTATARARRRGRYVNRYQYGQAEEVPLSRLPCWRHLSDEAYRRKARDLLAEIRVEITKRRKAEGAQLPGVRACIHRICRQPPTERPASVDERSPRPLCHAATRLARQRFREGLSAFLAAYRAASERMRRGERTAHFPPGSFPPPLPFVMAVVERPP